MYKLKYALGLMVVGLLIPISGFADPISLTGFESGTLAGWTFSGQGNAAVIAGIGGIAAFDGTRMALLSNGPGDMGGAFDQAQLLSNIFTLTAADTLSLAIRRLTAEFTGVDADPTRLDSYSVDLLAVGGGTSVNLHTSNVGGTGFSAIAGGPVSTALGDTFFDASGWDNLTMTGLSGSYRLSFRVNDAGDNSFDSAFLIDAGLAPTALPVPGTLVSLMGGLAIMLLMKRDKRNRSSRPAAQEVRL